MRYRKSNNPVDEQALQIVDNSKILPGGVKMLRTV